MAPSHALRLDADGNPLIYWPGQCSGRYMRINNGAVSFYLTCNQAIALSDVTLDQLKDGGIVRTECLVIRLDGEAVRLQQHGNSHGICLSQADFQTLTDAVRNGAVPHAKEAYARRQRTSGRRPAFQAHGS